MTIGDDQTVSLPGKTSIAVTLVLWAVIAMGPMVVSSAGEAISDPRVELTLRETDGSGRDVPFPVSAVRMENRNGLLNFAFAGPQDMIFQVNGLKVPDDQPQMAVPKDAYRIILMNTPWAEEAFTGPGESDNVSRCSWQGQGFPKTLSGEAVVKTPTGRQITATWSVQIHSWPAAQFIAPRHLPQK